MISKFLHDRSQRYTFSKEDCGTIYLVGVAGSRKLLNSQILNLSETGALCFLPSTEKVDIDDTFLFEFKVPGVPEMIVWKGRAARFQWSPKGIELGIEFLNLPPVFALSLRKGLKQKFREERIDSHMSALLNPTPPEKFKEWFIGSVVGALIVLAVSYMVAHPGTFSALNQYNIYDVPQTVKASRTDSDSAEQMREISSDEASQSPEEKK